MKFKLLFVTGLLAVGVLASCESKTQTLTFASPEIEIHSGDKVTIKENYNGVTYAIVSDTYESIKLDKNTGTFTYGDDIPNYTQVLYIATYKETNSEPIVVTLLRDYEMATIEFENLSDYIVNGEFVTGKASLPYAVSYSLKENVPGITINEYTGKVSYTSSVQDQTAFTVVAHTHNDVTKEKTFYAMTKNFITVENTRQVTEKGSSLRATFVLDFSNNLDVKEDGVIALTNEKNAIISPENYTYNKETSTLNIKPDYLNTLMDGENVFKIITAKNAITVNVDIATKFIYTPDDLASINDTVENLAGYYILMNDIDMASYLAEGGEGYNDGKGWTPIGLYDDVLDYNLSTRYSFRGTFDGNGHVISNVTANRHDERSFNCGLFGYITSSAIIKNLGVTGSFKVSSYSGGLVGSNYGTITNCWAKVDMEVYSGEGVYRYVGGFVGSNFGIIENCYSIGDVLCDSDFGSFVGYNEGDINNCLAIKTKNSSKFIGFGTALKSCILKDDLAQLQALDWTQYFSSENWEFINNELPKLKSTIKEYGVRYISIDRSVLANNYFMGDIIEFKTIIQPESFQSTYENQIKYSVEKNGGVYFDGNVLHTLNAKNPRIEVTVSLDYEDIILSDSITIDLNKKIDSIKLESSLTKLKAGYSYKLNASYEPSDATEDIIYHVEATDHKGIVINDDVLTIDENVSIEELSVYATSKFGKIQSNKLTFSIDLINKLDKDIIYENDTRNFEFVFDKDLDLSGIKVDCFGKAIAFNLVNNVVEINKAYVEDLKNLRIRFGFVLNDGTRYSADGYYISHEKYTLDYVKEHEKDAIEISSAEDFAKYFNVETYDESKFNNYNKTFVLTADIDMKGKTLFGIGFSSEENNNHAFNGKIYGCGHTISNFSISDNELAWVDTSQKSKYGVGLIGCLDGGELYDINLKNIKIRGNNFVGGLVGMMKSGIVENCAIIEDGTLKSSILAGKYEYSKDDIHVAGIVGIAYGGKCLANYYYDNSTNTVG